MNGETLLEAGNEAEAAARCGKRLTPDEARKGTIAYSILSAHNTSGNMEHLRLRFDSMASHDITFVGIIQTARASGMERFPLPYVLTNCHNTLCAVGGTINEDDHRFGLSAAIKYGGIYVPPHMAVIHQYMRERMAGCGKMILGSDSHTRYGALGTMAMGEGGGELVKQLLNDTYDIKRPEVVAVYLTGKPAPFVGPQDIALAIIGAVFQNGYVKNKVMEFVGPGVSSMTTDYRNGVDVMTTETTCLSSVWRTDEDTRDYLRLHGRESDYKKLEPADAAYYDGCVSVDLSEIRPMIALPFHPSNVYEIRELQENAADILHGVEEEAARIAGDRASFQLSDKLRDGALYVQQAVIAGCAGGTYTNIMEAANVLRAAQEGKLCPVGAGVETGAALAQGPSFGGFSDREFSLSVYPASQPVFSDLVKKGAVSALLDAGAVVRTAFCGPCFGAGDTPCNNGLSIRHTTRNFPNREGSKPGNGQMAAVALMDARSIAATAVNGGRLTSAEELPDAEKLFGHVSAYEYDDSAYRKRVYEGFGKAEEKQALVYGPNIKDWPKLPALAGHILLRVCAKIMDPVTTTDELIPSGETSSYRSNPLGLAEFTLSRRDPQYVSRAKRVQALETKRENMLSAGDGEAAFALDGGAVQENAGKAAEPGLSLEVQAVLGEIRKLPGLSELPEAEIEIGSLLYAVRPGDGSAREQAASCQRVLGGLANICTEYATKRYRSNVINWGMLPFQMKEAPAFSVDDWIFVPHILEALSGDMQDIRAYVIKGGMEQEEGTAAASGKKRKDASAVPISLWIAELTKEEREIIKAGCLINYNRNRAHR